MSTLTVDQLTAGSVVYMVDFGGAVVQGTVVAVKSRLAARTQVCIDIATKLILEEFYSERFFPSEKEAWYAVAMFAQRSASTAMANAATAFQKAGIAADAVPNTVTVSASGQ